MAEEEKKDKEEEKPAAAGGGLKALLLPVVLSAVTSAVVGFVMVTVLSPKPKAPTEEEALEAEAEASKHGESGGGHGGGGAHGGGGGGHGEKKEHTGNYHEYNSIVVSLYDREKVHYLKVKVALELSDPKVIEELQVKDPQIRDSLIFVLGDFSVRELLDNQAKLLVKDVLLKTLNKILGKGKVVDIYFTEFVVQ